MMRITLLLITFGLFLLITPAEAQYDQAKDGLGVRATFLNYQWPAIKDDFTTSDFTTGLEIEYIRHLNKFLNLGIPLKISEAELPTDEAGNYTSTSLASLDLLLQLKVFQERNFIYPYLYAGLGGAVEDFEDFHGVAPLGAGLNVRLSKHIYLSAKGEYRVGFENLRDNVQLAGGLLVLLGPGAPEVELEPVTDADNDGIPDDQDLCPNEAGTAGLNGCPDTDLDGIPDGEDDCPEAAGLAAFKGCPDSDGDGLADKDDDCPEEAGLISNKGCPLADADADGIPDDQDLCPNEAGFANLHGCPDGDGDGVADADDRCPDSPGPASNGGCPEISEEDEEVLDFATHAVQFETGSARLRVESQEVLDQIAGIMRRYPDYKLRIGGHTDSIGSASTNQKLSEERAKTCYEYLVSKGIDPSRISYGGYGESRPIADNRYKDGREKNRRVEFDLFLNE